MNAKTMFPLLAALMWITASCSDPAPDNQNNNANGSSCQVPYLELSNTFGTHTATPNVYTDQENCTYTYNSSGFAIESVCQSDTASDGVLDTEITTTMSNLTLQGDPQSISVAVDIGMNGVVDGTSIINVSYTYNVAEKILTMEEVYDAGTRYLTTNTYSAAGDLTTAVSGVDVTNDGVIDSSFTVSTTYNASHLPVVMTSTDNATIYMVITLNYTTVNGSGLPTLTDMQSDLYDAAGVNLLGTSYGQMVTVYDTNGNITNVTGEDYSDAALTTKLFGMDITATWSACSSGVGIAAASSSSPATSLGTIQQSKVDFSEMLRKKYLKRK